MESAEFKASKDSLMLQASHRDYKRVSITPIRCLGETLEMFYKSTDPKRAMLVRLSENKSYILRKEMITAFFDIPSLEAAREMGVSLTLLKKIRAWGNVQRWPCSLLFNGGSGRQLEYTLSKVVKKRDELIAGLELEFVQTPCSILEHTIQVLRKAKAYAATYSYLVNPDSGRRNSKVALKDNSGAGYPGDLPAGYHGVNEFGYFGCIGPYAYIGYTGCVGGVGSVGAQTARTAQIAQTAHAEKTAQTTQIVESMQSMQSMQSIQSMQSMQSIQQMKPKNAGKRVKLMNVLVADDGLEFVEDLVEYADEEEGKALTPPLTVEGCLWPLTYNEHNAYSMESVDFVGQVMVLDDMDDVLGLGPLGAISLTK